MTYCRICTTPTVAIGPEDHEVLCRSCFTAAVGSTHDLPPVRPMVTQELELLIRAGSPTLPLAVTIFTPELSAQVARLLSSRRPSLAAAWVDGRMCWRLEERG